MPEHAHCPPPGGEGGGGAGAMVDKCEGGLYPKFNWACAVHWLWNYCEPFSFQHLCPFCWRCVLWWDGWHVCMLPCVYEHFLSFLLARHFHRLGRHSTGVWPTPLHKANKNKQTKPSSTLDSESGFVGICFIFIFFKYFFLTFIISRSWEAERDTRTLRADLLLCVTVFSECIVCLCVCVC